MLTQILLLLLLLLLFYVYCSTMVFRKSVVISVLVAVASKSVFADVGLSPRGGENRRQLKRGKKSKPTASPTISGRPAFTRGTIELRFYVPVVEGVLQGITHLGAIDALDTSQSIVGSKTIMTAGGDQIFKADDVNKENALNEFSITTTFETTVGSFETGIEQSSCDVTLCLTVPRIGGCVFLRSGGQYLFNPFPPANETVSPPMTAASIGGTGIGFHGQQAFVSFRQNEVPESNGDIVFEFDITIIETVEQTENNKLHAEEIPGFVPLEGLGEFTADSSRSRQLHGEDYSSFSLANYIDSL